MNEPGLPIAALLPAIASHLDTHTRLVLEAPPGAGKTTQVPLALRDAPWLQGRRIIMLEPRRVAARAAATYMAAQLGEAVGGTVGYRIRFENRTSARTRLEVVTEGILTRMLQDDPLLEGVGALLFDEFHERHLAADLGLALALDVQAGLREDLRIVVMSATLDGARLADFLDAPRVSSPGRSFPVNVAHLPARRDESLLAQARRAILQGLDAHPGDVLVFLPGRREIGALKAALDACLPAGVACLALHGELPVAAQAQVLQPDAQGGRRVVLATNVAESSVTLPGVRVVIDSGQAREPRTDPGSGFSRLDVVTIAQASADQRAGRAGRVAEGWAYRLWPASQRLDAQRRPEIAHADLSALALELAAWGSEGLRFFDPPAPGAMAAARELLRQLGALTPAHADGAMPTLTGTGRRMLALGTHPRLAAMLLAPTDPMRRALACDLVALLEARDPLRSRSDALATRWQALAAWRSRGAMPAETHRSALVAIDQSAAQWRRRCQVSAPPPAHVPAHVLGELLAHAFPDWIAHQHPGDPWRYLLANGRTARLSDDSDLHGEPWLVACDLRLEARDARLLRGAPLDAASLRQVWAERFSEGDETRWDPARRALVAERIQRFDRIVLDARPAGRVDPAQAAQALTRALVTLGVAALPWTPGLQQWRLRVGCLRQWMPSLALPDLSDAALQATRDAWLMPLFSGLTRWDALTAQAFSDGLRGLLTWPQQQALQQLAPETVHVPSGLARPVSYALQADGTPAAPVLAVKLQELFGLAQTPCICDGQVPLLLHLLSPAGRPLQVTGDLAGFWTRTYPDVRREMKGRYPRHPWPDDPWSATATHRAKPRAR